MELLPPLPERHLTISLNKMKNRPVVFLDSGIGSLPYGECFCRLAPFEEVICVADRANFPYGSKPREDVASLVSALTGEIINRYNPKIVALACNTASVSALDVLRKNFPGFQFVGTVPAVKPAMLLSRSRKVGILATERTIEEQYTSRIADEVSKETGKRCEIKGEAAPGLVEFVERSFASATEEERLSAVKPWVEKFKVFGADVLVLGCTHFLLLLKEFNAVGGTHIRICDSLDGVCRRVKSLLDESGTGDNSSLSQTPQNQLLFTGGGSIDSGLVNLAEHFSFKAGLF